MNDPVMNADTIGAVIDRELNGLLSSQNGRLFLSWLVGEMHFKSPAIGIPPDPLATAWILGRQSMLEVLEDRLHHINTGWTLRHLADELGRLTAAPEKESPYDV